MTRLELDPIFSEILLAHGVAKTETRSIEHFVDSVSKLKNDVSTLTLFMRAYLAKNTIVWREYFDSIQALAVESPAIIEAGSRVIEEYAKAALNSQTGQLLLPLTQFPMDARATDAVAAMFLRGSKASKFGIPSHAAFVEALTMSPETRTKLLRKGILREINTPVTKDYFLPEAVEYMLLLMSPPTLTSLPIVGYNEKIVTVTLPAYIKSFSVGSANQKLAIEVLMSKLASMRSFEGVIRTDAYTYDAQGEPEFIKYVGPEAVTISVLTTAKIARAKALTKDEKILFNTNYSEKTLKFIETRVLESFETTVVWLSNPNVARAFVEQAYATFPYLRGNVLSITYPDISLRYFLIANEDSREHFQTLADSMN